MIDLIRKILLFSENVILKTLPKKPSIYQFFKSYIKMYNGEGNSNMYTNGEMRFLQCNLKKCSIVFD